MLTQIVQLIALIIFCCIQIVAMQWVIYRVVDAYVYIRQQLSRKQERIFWMRPYGHN